MEPNSDVGFSQEGSAVRVWTVGSPATALMQWRSTILMVIFGGKGLVFHVHSSPYAPADLTQEWLQERFMCVDTIKEQVTESRISTWTSQRDSPPLLFCLLPLDRHEDIIKDILELDPWDNRWTVVARRALMHDNYDVCLVAHLNPRGLMGPPADLVKQ